jgi:hypothetical protein
MRKSVKQIVVNGLITVILLLVINLGIRRVFDPSPYYGNDSYLVKMELYKADTIPSDNLMVGSSCIFWNLNTPLFDSLLPSDITKTTFNFGGGGTLPPEIYYFVEYLLERESDGIRSLVIELRDIGRFPDHHRYTLRKRYFMTPRWYLFIVNVTLNGSQNNTLKRNMIARYGMALTERLLNIGYFNDLYGQPEDQRYKYLKMKENLITRGVRGYLPMHEDREAREENRADRDTVLPTILAATYRNAMQHPEYTSVNTVHLRKLTQLIKECEKRNIHCLFLLHPKHEDEVSFREAIALSVHLPAIHVIDVADPDKYPELYLQENSLNRNHFNISGTSFLTTFAAGQFTELHSRWKDSLSSGN